MEQTTNLENQNLDQNVNQTTPQKNNYKILFFIFLTLFTIISIVLIILLITKNKESKLATKNQETQVASIVTPTVTVTNSTEVLNTLTPTKSITTPTPTKSTTTSSIPKDWKTYNSKIGISLNIPSTCSFTDAINKTGWITIYSYGPDKYPAAGGLPVNEFKIDIYFADKMVADSFNDLLNSKTDEYTKIISKSKLIILGYNANLINTTGEAEGPSESRTYLINKDDSLFVASILMNRNTKENTKNEFYTNFTKIVESIKFN